MTMISLPLKKSRNITKPSRPPCSKNFRRGLAKLSRKKREVARNIIDTRWGSKWKWERDAVEVNAAIGGRGSVEADGKSGAKRTIRARLTVRGFKDHDRHDFDRYAGTSSRSSQKVLVSEAVLHGWDIATAYISKAFLQCVTYKELAELTGDKIREVIFYLPIRM